ncbi:MAG: RHS repeat-associated core domain-containing protein [Arenimonas sp.]
MKIPSHFYDSESGLHYNYLRDYESGTGRYLQNDPADMQGLVEFSN